MNIKEVRKRIDGIDQKILKLISERFALLPHVIKYKIDNNLPIQDIKREKEILQNRIKEAKYLKINPKFVQDIFKNIMVEARKIQKVNLNKVKNANKK